MASLKRPIYFLLGIRLVVTASWSCTGDSAPIEKAFEVVITRQHPVYYLQPYICGLSEKYQSLIIDHFVADEIYPSELFKLYV